jgi:hypothetical protein
MECSQHRSTTAIPIGTYAVQHPSPHSALASRPPPAALACTDSGSGLTLTNMSVLPLPPRQGCSRWVSLELRYGMCPLLVASAYSQQRGWLCDCLQGRGG